MSDGFAYLFGDEGIVPDDEWIECLKEDETDYLLRYAVQNEMIYYCLLGENGDVV